MAIPLRNSWLEMELLPLGRPCHYSILETLVNYSWLSGVSNSICKRIRVNDSRLSLENYH